MHAVDVLDYKVDLMLKLQVAGVRRAWGAQLKADTLDAIKYQGGSAYGLVTAEVAERNAVSALQNLAWRLPDAEAYHVSPEMCTVVQYSATQLNDEDAIDLSFAPADAGLVRFDGGMPFTDVRGKQMFISWLAWVPVELTDGKTGHRTLATQIFLWNDHREEPDDIYRDMVRHESNFELYDRTVGRWGFIGAETLVPGQGVGSAMQFASEEKVAQILAAGDTPSAFGNAIRLVHAFWLMTRQTITVTEPAPVPKPQRKRAERNRIPARVTVVMLRHKSTKRAEGETKVEWSCRWVVKSDWAWRRCGREHPLAQPYPESENAGLYRARVWVNGYVKGPDDKPLVIKPKVYALHR